MHPAYGLPKFELKGNSNQTISWTASKSPLDNLTIAGTFAKNETWFISTRLSHPVRKATIRLFRVNIIKSRIGLKVFTKAFVGVVDEKEWIGRNNANLNQYQTKFTFNGTVAVAGSKPLWAHFWPFGKSNENQDSALPRFNVTSGTYYFELIFEKTQSGVGMFKNWAWLGPVADWFGLRKQVETWWSPLVEIR